MRPPAAERADPRTRSAPAAGAAPPVASATSNRIVAWYGATLFTSAVLVFWIQLLTGKLLLPRFGGTPAVWTSCLLFYQTLLLAGYAHADRVARIADPRRALAVHGALLLAGAACLPLRLPVLPVLSAQHPVLQLLTTLTLAVGPPFVALAATAPLMQRWFSRLGLAASTNPYPLYALSNLGSVVGLLAYPFLLEPRLTLAQQRLAWSLLYALACIAILGAGLPLLRAAGLATVPATASSVSSLRRRLQWLVLSCIPASLMYGVTAMLATDIGSVPLLWVVPLALYLLTFVAAFSTREQAAIRRAASVALPVLLAMLAVSFLLNLAHPVWLVPTAHLVGFFLAAYVLHGELAARRPPAEEATSFYLWMAFGGTLAGVGNAVVAPLVFDTILEYPLALGLTVLVLHAIEDRAPGTVTPGFASRVAAVTLVASIVLAGARSASVAQRWPGVVAIALLLAALRWIFPLTLAPLAITIVLAILTGQYASAGGTLLHVERSFFGVHRVVATADGARLYLHGTTLHGRQSGDSTRRREPLTYFHPSGPIGQLLANAPAGRFARVAVLGLGAGSLAAYARTGERWDFYEIDPTVERIARDPRWFTFLADAAAARVVIGDARLELAASPERYDLIVADAFSSDAMPVHLFTREAFALYGEHLRPGGILAVNVTNRFLDLAPVLAATANELGLRGIHQVDGAVSLDDTAVGKSASHWALLVRAWPDLGAVARDPRWRPLDERVAAEPWTDDHSDVLSVMRFER